MSTIQPTYKKIRFVVQDEKGKGNSGQDGGPLESHRPKRAQAACTPCRSKKIRCSGTGPPCETCASNSRNCNYPSRERQGGVSNDQSSSSTRSVKSNRKTLNNKITTPHKTNLATSSASVSHSMTSVTGSNDGAIAESPTNSSSSTSSNTFPTPGIREASFNNSNPNVPSSSLSVQRDALQNVSQSFSSSALSATMTAPTQVPFEPENPYNQPASGSQPMYGDPQLSSLKNEGDPASGTFDIPPPSSALGMEFPHGDQKDEKPPLPIRAPYFRYLGPTAIAPGAPFRRLSLKVRRASESDHSSPSQQHSSPQNPSPIQSHSTTTTTGAVNNIGSPSIGTSHAQAPFPPPIHLIDRFYRQMGSFLPFLRPADLKEKVMNGTISEVLLNIMAALGERLEPNSGGVNLAEIYANKAKRAVMANLSLPTLDTVYALLLIAYHEFGEDRDSGLWMWCGLAVRMCMDMGLHKNFESGRNDASLSPTGCPDSDPYVRKRVFWSVFQLDRVISSGTGRVATIREEEIEVDLPFGDPSELETGLPDPFPYLCKVLIILGRTSDFFNRPQHAPPSSFPPRSLSNSNWNYFYSRPPQQILQELQSELEHFHGTLPPSFHFNVANFRRYTEAGQGQAFLLMHAWFHTIILITTHPTLVPARRQNKSVFADQAGGGSGSGQGSSNSTPKGWQEWYSLELSRSSARSISDMIAFSDLIDPNMYLSTPFISQPILMSGCASLLEAFKASSGLELSSQPPAMSQPSSSSDPKQDRSGRTLFGTVAHHNFTVCRDALAHQQNFWRGVSWLCDTLQSKADREAEVDLSEKCDGEVTLDDDGAIRRATADLGKMMLGNETREARNLLAALAGFQNIEDLVGISVSGLHGQPPSDFVTMVGPQISHADPQKHPTGEQNDKTQHNMGAASGPLSVGEEMTGVSYQPLISQTWSNQVPGNFNGSLPPLFPNLQHSLMAPPNSSASGMDFRQPNSQNQNPHVDWQNLVPPSSEPGPSLEALLGIGSYNFDASTYYSQFL